MQFSIHHISHYLKIRPSFRGKILTGIIALVFILTATTLILVDRRERHQVDQRLLEHIESAVRAVVELHDGRMEQIFARSNIFMRSTELRNSIINAPATSARIAAEFRQQTGLEFVMIVQYSGTVLVDGLNPTRLGKKIDDKFVPLLTRAVNDGTAFEICEDNGRLYQVGALPYSQAGAVILAGAEITDRFSYKVDELIRSQISYYYADQIKASAFSKEGRAELKLLLLDVHKKPQVDLKQAIDAAAVFEMSIAGENFRAVSAVLPGVPKAGLIISVSQDKGLQTLRQIERTIVFTGLIGLIVAIIFAVLFSRSVTRSVNRLMQDVEKIKEGDLEHSIEATSNDEIGVLSERFNSLRIAFRDAQKELQRYAETLEQKVKERTADINIKNEIISQHLRKFEAKEIEIDQELDIAQRIQWAILPSENAHARCNAVACYDALHRVSGDFYDICDLDDGSTLILMADASGHGVPAAFVTIMAKIYFAAIVKNESNPGAILSGMNDMLYELLAGQSMYLTAFVIKISPDNTMEYCNASHPLPIIIRKNSQDIHHLDSSGFMIGIVGDAIMRYETLTTQLDAGDKIILYTDGVTDATNAKNEMYGPERLVAVAARDLSASIVELNLAIMADVRMYQDGTPDTDDVTTLVIEILPPATSLT